MKFVPQKISRAVGNQKLTLQKNAPHITFGVGAFGVIVSTVLACRATLKLEETLTDIHDEINDVKQHREEGDPQRTQDLAYVYGKSVGKMVRLYGPPAIAMTASLGLMTHSHMEMTKRNKALMATIGGLTKAYDAYRERVRAEVGEDREREIYYGIHEETVLDENGKKVKAMVPLGDPSQISEYARLFDEYSPNWQKDPEMNRIFVQVQQNYANHLLKTRGHVFLNEIYDNLGIERSRAGAVVGWLDGGDGDNYIDFGLFTTDKTGFVNGWERSVLLDFNVDGVIYDKIG